MSLDPPKSDAQLLRELAEKEAAARARAGSAAAAVVAGVGGLQITLGPESPLLPTARAPRRRAPRLAESTSEHLIQVGVFEWSEDPRVQLVHPELALLHAIPNGGHRTLGVAAKLKAEGVKPGVPDLDLPVARGGYFGLRIEVKKPGGTTSPEQADWLVALARQNRKVALCTTTEGIKFELLTYLSLYPTQAMPHP